MAKTTTPDHEFDPTVEPESSAAWLNLIEDAEKKFSNYQDKADRIDCLYADLDRQASNVRDPQFAMFWANIQVLGPSVYSRPPVPVVVPEFKERDPLKRTASELLERALIKTYDLGYIDETMRLVRDDMLIVGRGVPWVRYETKAEARDSYATDDGYERVCIDFIDRKDFLHDPARYWPECGWVARRAWKTRKEMRDRFEKHSGDAYLMASYNVEKTSRPDGASDPREQCGVWEIWSRTHNKVVWVAEGVEVLLDSGKPHHSLEGFYPCPKPAYTTLQRRSLIPVPDMAYYKDQLDEINKLTSRIHALSDAVQVKGFYPGGGEIGDAIEAAMNIMDDRKVMIPVSNFAAFGSGGETIVWLPIDMIATTIAGLIEMRRSVIDDVYQITGLSDVMRGATDPGETLGAQQLKSQYGSVRVRDRQYELVRVAKDITRIAGEIMAENFNPKTLQTLAQMELPTRAGQARKVQEIEAKAKQGMKQAEQAVQRAAQQDPEAAQQIQQQVQQQIQQAAQQIAELETTPTIEDVMELLRNQRIRPFALDIETDSTIQPDEDAEKQRRAEFLTALGGTMQQLAPLVMQAPKAAGFAGELLKFALAPFRVGRELEGSVDEFVEEMANMASQPKGGDEAEKAMAAANMKIAEAQLQKAQADTMKVQADAQGKAQETQLRAAEAAEKAKADQARIQLEMQETRGTIAETSAKIEKIYAEIQKMGVDAQNQTRQQEREDVKAASDIQGQQEDRAMHAQDHQRQAFESDRDAAKAERGEDRADRAQSFSERQGDRQQTFAERQAEREGAE